MYVQDVEKLLLCGYKNKLTLSCLQIIAVDQGRALSAASALRQ